MPLVHRVCDVGMGLLFVGGIAFAIGWWWLMPGGFPVDHIRFWTNAVWPLLLSAVCLGGIVAQFLQRPRAVTLCAWFTAVAALSAAATAIVVYPDLVSRLANTAIAFGLVASAGVLVSASAPRPVIPMALVAFPAIVFGGFMPWSLRADIPSTAPLNITPVSESANAAALTDGGLGRSIEPFVRLTQRTTIYPSAGAVTLGLESVRLEIEPLLSFDSVSQSGGWTIFSRQGPERTSRFGRFDRETSSDARTRSFFGRDVALSIADRDTIKLESFTKVEAPVYSHLNSFCALRIDVDGPVELEFSPCGAKRFTPMPADYPTGRPARFAYCDADRRFHVVEATSGEKGPFHELGSGRLPHDGPLTIGVVVAGRLAADVQFHDWSSQLSTALSPTAGWGVAANAIEFQRIVHNADDVDDMRGPVLIWITLAGTSVGRGWDTVGHAAGTYRNRIVVEPLTDSVSTSRPPE